MPTTDAGEPLISLVNGEFEGRVAVTDRGLAYGDGLFETIRVAHGKPVLLDLHMQRLVAGLQRLQIRAGEVAVRQQLLHLLSHAGDQGLKDGVVKLIVSRGDGGRGFKPDPRGDATVVCSWFELPEYSTKALVSGVELFTCKIRLAHRPHLAGLKHLNCLDYVLASLEQRGRVDSEGLLLDEHGSVIEATSANLLLVSRGELSTPSLNRCGVAGTMRRWIMEVAAPELGLVVNEGELSLDHLRDCDELFICNSVRGVIPVVAFEDCHWRRGPITAALQTRVLKLFDA